MRVFFTLKRSSWASPSEKLTSRTHFSPTPRTSSVCPTSMAGASESASSASGASTARTEIGAPVQAGRSRTSVASSDRKRASPSASRSSMKR